MDFSIKGISLKEYLSESRVRLLLFSLLIGLTISFLCFGKPYLSLSLASIAVSSDEEYIAYFEPSTNYTIRCFRADGSIAFTYIIPTDISAGGLCTLWFENDTLCALFYRTNKKVQFSLDGSMMTIVDNSDEYPHSEYPSFSHIKQQYIFDGKEIDVVYDTKNFFGYWLFGAKRSLTIISRDGTTRTLYAWTAKEVLVK